jgi:two-component system sensor histidine kinase AlgZ
MSNTNLKSLGFLPNMCASQTLLRLLLAAIALAFVLSLAVADTYRSFFIDLGLTTLFVVWVGIMSALIACMLNRFLKRKNPLTASIIIIAVVAAFTLMASILGVAGRNYSSPEQIQYWDTLFVFKNLFLASILSAIGLRYFYMQHQWEQHVQTDSKAKFTALQSRMRPHFLFNSLNSIAQLITTDADRAEESLLDLADIFRSTLDTRDRVTLNEELDVATRYLRIEGLRLGKRLSVVWDMDKNSLPFGMSIPPLLLQPLIENAIYHGIQPRKDGGTLGISLYDAGDYLDISVSNPTPPEGTTSHSKGNHIAQENLKNRLKLAYGDRAKLSITKSEHQYRVAFRIPKE